ncbi:MAG: AAA family ATPase [Bacteroidales bacterium]|jgi:hypothetical protein|nr:AAA family ATPase [Bacteroidales bacterium]
MNDEKIKTNEQLLLAKKYVEETNTNIFLTGKAGTGKTTFLRGLQNTLPKRMVVLAPTGVAAINANGATIHSFFQISFGPFLEKNVSNNKNGNSHFRFSKNKLNIIRSLELIIIDEISMVRADLLDAIDYTLRLIRYRQRNIPFGGVQLLMIGDLQQLPPVCKDEEWDMLHYYYDTPYFFSSIALQKSSFITINLKEVFRQKDKQFINILNAVRNNNITEKLLDKLNDRSNVDFDPSLDEGYIILTTHNYQAKQINDSKLKNLDFPIISYTATVNGEFPENSYPNDFILELKIDAQVMFIKNDIGEFSKRKYYNGKIGKIVSLDEDTIVVRCPNESEDIVVKKHTWNNLKYEINPENNEIEQISLGTFEQYPLRLAWAITIHKSQGLTFDKVIINSNQAFASGQVYVALSRCRTLEGIILSSTINPQSIIVDNTLVEFDKEQEENIPSKERLENDSILYLEKSLLDLFSFNDIKYILDDIEKLSNEEICKTFLSSANRINDKIKIFNKNIFEVGLKFEKEIRKLSPKGVSEKLIERIIKGAEYFIFQLKDIVDIHYILDDINLDSKLENKKITLSDSFFYELILKIELFKVLDENFSLKNFLHKRNNLIIENPKKLINSYKEENSSFKKKTISQDTQNKDLFEALREWRKLKCKEENKEAYMILRQSSLIEISNTLPLTEKELINIKGIGKKKVAQYGKEILDIVYDYKMN